MAGQEQGITGIQYAVRRNWRAEMFLEGWPEQLNRMSRTLFISHLILMLASHRPSYDFEFYPVAMEMWVALTSAERAEFELRAMRNTRSPDSNYLRRTYNTQYTAYLQENGLSQ